MKNKLMFIAIVAAVVLFSQCAGANLDDSLIGKWTFDDGAGAALAEATGNSAAGEITGDGTWKAEGKIGGSYQFTGADNYILIPGNFYLTNYTMTVWFKADLRFDNQDVISAYAEGIKHGVLLEIRDSGVLRYLHRFPLASSSDADVQIYTEQDIYMDSQWHFTALVKSNETITLYVDGEMLGQESESSTAPGETMNVVLGVLDTERNMRYFKGEMDDFRMYNKALTQDDVLSIMAEAEM